MGQTVDNGLGNISTYNNDIYKQGQDIGSGSAFGVDKSKTYGSAPGVAEDIINGFKYEKGNSSAVNSTIDNFEEYLKTKQEKAKEAGEDAATEEKEAKEEAKEISRSLSSEEIKQLEMMGIDVTSAKLSDIMGMVNTMRGQAHRDEMQQMLASISAANGDMEGVTLVGGTAKIAGTDIEIESVEVSDVIANEAKQADKTQGFSIGENELVYILKNELNLTKDNLYKAHYSGSMVNKEGAFDDLMEQMMPQIEKIIAQAGLEGDEKALDGAKFLMDNNIPVTTGNLKVYMDYQQYVGMNVMETEIPESQQEAVTEKAQELSSEITKINPEIAYDMIYAGKQLTIASMISYFNTNGGRVSKDAKDFYAKVKNSEEGNQTVPEKPVEENKSDILEEMSEKDAKAVTAMRQLEEIRLSMTVDAATKLVKSDFNIDTKELSKVVSKLKNMEEQIIKNQLKQANVEPTKENINLYNEITDKIQGIGAAHARVIASPLKGLDFSVNTLYAEGVSGAEGETSGEYETVRRDVKGGNFEAAFRDATRSYEAVGTAPRADMGDSIGKAFSNVADILKEMDIPVNYENERAVRILGYNSIEITAENISQVVEYDRQVNELMNTFYPEAVLSMIKDGINPLDVPIEELNETIRKHNYNEGVTEAENFATYLRDMEKQGLVSPEERESYIGIYRVMNRLAKSGDREAGWIFNNGSRLTVRNLISAMRSRKATGLDVAIDESFGMLSDVTTLGKDIEKQIDSAFNIKTSGDFAGEENMSDSIEENSGVDKESDVQKLMDKVAQASEEVWTFLKENNIETTGVNIMAVEAMISTQGGIYQLVSDILAKMKFTTDAKEELVDEETENMSDSMTGESVAIDFMPESILESLRGSEEMSLKYEDLRDKLTELMYSAGVTGTITSIDISAIKTVSAGFNIMSNMAKSDKYQLPVETEQGIKVVNLTVVHDATNKGTIEISMDGGEFGDIAARIKVGGNGNLYGHIVASTSEGNYMLQSNSHKLSSVLVRSGFKAEEISVGRIENAEKSSGAGEMAESKTLYEASVALVKAMGSVL